MQKPSLVQEAPEYDSTGAVEDPEGQEGSVAQCLLSKEQYQEGQEG